MSSIPLISHHLFVAAAKSKPRAGRRPVRVAPGFGHPTARAIEAHLFNANHLAPSQAAWPLEFLPRNGPA